MRPPRFPPLEPLHLPRQTIRRRPDVDANRPRLRANDAPDYPPTPMYRRARHRASLASPACEGMTSLLASALVRAGRPRKSHAPAGDVTPDHVSTDPARPS